MLCEKCGKNNATTHIRTVVNGVVREVNLCGYCAAKEGYATVGHNSLAGMLASMLGEVSNPHIASKTVKCPICGASFSDIAESGSGSLIKKIYYGIKDSVLGKIILSISLCSYGMYLTHYFVIWLLIITNDQTHILDARSPFKWIPLLFLAAFLFSWSLTWIFSKIKFMF